LFQASVIKHSKRCLWTN